MQSFGSTLLVVLYPGESSSENNYWLLITVVRNFCFYVHELVISLVIFDWNTVFSLQESIRLVLLSNMIILIGPDDQFPDLVILSFFLTADHLNGLSSFGGPLHLIVPATPHHPYPAFCFCLLGSTRLPASSSWFTGSSRTIGWDFTKRMYLKMHVSWPRTVKHVFHFASGPLTCSQQESSLVWNILHILTWEVKYSWVYIGYCNAILLHVCSKTCISFHYSSVFRNKILLKELSENKKYLHVGDNFM